MKLCQQLYAIGGAEIIAIYKSGCRVWKGKANECPEYLKEYSIGVITRKFNELKITIF